MALFSKGADGGKPKASPKHPKKKADNVKKPRKSPVTYVKEVIAELKKVTWPTRKELVSYSVVVSVFIVLMAGVLFLMDTLFGSLLSLIV